MKREKINLEHLTDEQLDEFLEYVELPFTAENQRNIEANFAAQTAKPQKVKFLKQRKRRRIWAGILSAVAVITLFAGFSKAGELRMLYLRNFGSGATKLLANSDELSQTATYDGLTLKALATFKDTQITYFLSQLTDTTGDRLAADLEISDWEMLSGGNTKVVDYDETTKTATLLTRAVDIDGSGTNGFLLKGFNSHRHEISEIAPTNLAENLQDDPTWVDISKQSAKGGGYNEKLATKLGIDWDKISETALKPMEIDQILSNDLQISLSNIGYRDGFLHLQIKNPVNSGNNALFVSLVNKATGEKTTDICSYGVDQGTHNNEIGRPAYEEFVFNIPQNELANYQIELFGERYDTDVKGEWAIQLAPAQSLETKKIADTTININGSEAKLSNIVLSPMSLSFDYQISSDKLSLPCKFIMKDGTEKAQQSSDLTMATGKNSQTQTYTYEFGYLDLAQIQAITIAGETLTVQ